MTRQTAKPMTSASASISQAIRAGMSVQHEIDPHMLAAAQKPRRGEQRDDVERVFGDFVGPGKAGAREIAQDDVGGDHDDHRQQRQRGEHRERVEELGEGV